MHAAALKSWREAASLILVSCRKRILHPVMGEVPPSPDPSNMELELMLINRNDKSAFRPNTYVLPGGAAENADFSPKWLPLFGVSTSQCAISRFDFAKPVEALPPMFRRARCVEFSEVPSEIAFRICAIRETFKETGVLMARSIDQTNFNFSAHTAYPYKFGDSLTDQEALRDWRKKVKTDPINFLSMCRSLEVVPDVWSLYTWANWLSPISSIPCADRFDTAYFICCLKEHPEAQVELDLSKEDKVKTEIKHNLQWSSPRQMLYDYMENRAEMAPPQVYEASRLIKFSTVEELMNFLKFRADQPVERWMPVVFDCADAIVYIYPGDTLYPDCPRLEGVDSAEQRVETAAEMNCKSPNHHRFILHKGCVKPDGSPLGIRHFQLRHNTDPRYKHITPTDYGV